MNSRVDVDVRYFIYALLDPKIYRSTKDELRSIFYVGKGTGTRHQHHEAAVRHDLRKQDQLFERLDSKAHRIHQILDRGERIPILFLAENINNEADAYTAESLAMTLVDGLLTRCGQGPLTNAISGHHQGVRRVGESDLGGVASWEGRFRMERVDIGSRQLDIEAAVPASVILVKGRSNDLKAYGQRLSRSSQLPHQMRAFAECITVLEFTEEPPTPRPGWDPDSPWDDIDARERARRYWTFGRERVAGWLSDPQMRPTHLMLGVETPSGETVVRYAWEIDPEGRWEYFPNGSWGVPLGRRHLDHPFLNHALYETNEHGVRRQVLHARSAGWRHLVC